MKFWEMYVRFRLSEKTKVEWSQFHCGDKDLDEFFLEDAANYEQQEKDYISLSAEKELKTRLMYFDLMLM
jgi:hypothetical protein